MRRSLVAGLLLALAVTLPVSAGKVTGNAISLNGLAVGFGEYQRFSVTVAKSQAANAYVYVQCAQDGSIIWNTYSIRQQRPDVGPALDPGIRMGFRFDVDPASPTYDQQVMPSSWTGGSASCTGELRTTKSTSPLAGPISWDTP